MSGDKRAVRDAEFIAFAQDARPRLRRVAFLMCGDWDAADDLVQTALVKVYMRWSRLDPGTDPWFYARRTVVNAAIDEKRRPWRREAPTCSIPDAAVPDTHPMNDAVVDALASLSSQQRAVVVLRYIEDLDNDTTAALLDLPPNTVKSHAARGLAALRRRLNAPTASGGNR